MNGIGSWPKELFAWAIRYSGVPWLIRRLWSAHRVSIAVYHDPAPDVLDRHLAYMARRYHFVSLGQALDALQAGDPRALPRNPLVVTLDDGHAGNRALGDVFRRHGVRPTIYLCSQIAGTRRGFWFQAGDEARMIALKRLRDTERQRRLEREFGFSREREDPSTRAALSRDDLAGMREWADFGSHSRFHPILTTCDDAECEREIRLSRSELEALLGAPCSDFAFPNGDYTERELALVESAGYRSARTVDVGWNSPSSDLFRLRITGVTDDASLNLLAAQLSGVSAWLRLAASGSFRGRQLPITLPAAGPAPAGSPTAGNPASPR